MNLRPLFLPVLLALALLAPSLTAQSLRFTAGAIFNTNQVKVTVTGPTNTWCWLERLNRTNQTWDIVETYTTGSAGSVNLTNSLHQGYYGIFRTRSTNNSYYSTNAFGAVVGYAPSGYSLLGNPFADSNVTNTVPAPYEDTLVYPWIPAAGAYDTLEYVGGAWNTNQNLVALDGFFLYNPSTNGTLRYQLQGIFATNSVTKALPTGYSLIASPRFQLLSTTTNQVDLLTTNRLGGYSGLPVQASGYNPQCVIDRYVWASSSYASYELTSGNVWQLDSTNSPVPLHLGEGFWIDRATNANWTVSRTVW